MSANKQRTITGAVHKVALGAIIGLEVVIFVDGVRTAEPVDRRLDCIAEARRLRLRHEEGGHLDRLAAAERDEFVRSRGLRQVVGGTVLLAPRGEGAVLNPLRSQDKLDAL